MSARHRFPFAAETDVDRCETEPDHAFATNAMGRENVALYQPTLDSIEFFYGRLSKGGVVVADDYGSSPSFS